MTETITNLARRQDDAPGTAFVTGLVNVARHYAEHVDPARLNIPVSPGAPGARIAELDEIAETLGVDVTERDGMLIAERDFGDLVVEAHLARPDGSTSGHGRRSARTGAAA